MSEDEIISVFKHPFHCNPEFAFDILQHGGGKFKSLVVPSLSSSYAWIASAVAGSSKSPIYILTHSDFVSELISVGFDRWRVKVNNYKHLVETDGESCNDCND